MYTAKYYRAKIVRTIIATIFFQQLLGFSLKTKAVFSGTMNHNFHRDGYKCISVFTVEYLLNSVQAWKRILHGLRLHAFQVNPVVFVTHYCHVESLSHVAWYVFLLNASILSRSLRSVHTQWHSNENWLKPTVVYCL